MKRCCLDGTNQGLLTIKKMSFYFNFIWFLMTRSGPSSRCFERPVSLKIKKKPPTTSEASIFAFSATQWLSGLEQEQLQQEQRHQQVQLQQVQQQEQWHQQVQLQQVQQQHQQEQLALELLLELVGF
jgi:hypothetical protein